jgi:hypothetical protein
LLACGGLAHICPEEIKVRRWDGELSSSTRLKGEGQVYFLSNYDPDKDVMDLVMVDFVKDNVIKF